MKIILVLVFVAASMTLYALEPKKAYVSRAMTVAPKDPIRWMVNQKAWITRRREIKGDYSISDVVNKFYSKYIDYKILKPIVDERLLEIISVENLALLHSDKLFDSSPPPFNGQIDSRFNAIHKDVTKIINRIYESKVTEANKDKQTLIESIRRHRKVIVKLKLN